jgi:poly-gamma-glutamate synthesis protein (capsule biosynthesis protein)
VVRLVAVGDVMLARSIGDLIEAAGPGSVFAGVAGVLAEADLAVANLECTIAEAGAPEPKAFVFDAPGAAADALVAGGIDVVSLANNHALDLGRDGLADMLPRLAERRIGAVGAGLNAEAARAPLLIEQNGVRLGFLAYVDVPVESSSGFDTRSWEAGPDTAGVAWAHAASLAEDVAAAHLQADVVIVLLHFGLESRPEVTPAQRTLARAAVDAGASLVIGAHPHVLQPVEEYGGGLLVYSLGNFVFDGFSGLANDTAILAATLTPAGLESYAWVPAVVEQGLPRLATESEAARILPQLGLP